MTFHNTTGLSLTVALQINEPVMLDHALDGIFEGEISLDYHNFTCVESRHQGVIRALICSSLFDDRVKAETLNIRVQIENGVGESTARKHIGEAMSMKLITESKALNNNQENCYKMAPGVQGKLNELGLLKMKISEVIKEQLANPLDHKAGSELVPDWVYFNAIDPDVRIAARKEMARRVKEIEDKKNKKEKSND